MTAMGNHSKPVDGVPVANGHAPVSELAPFKIPSELQVRQGGPVTPWPQPAKPDKEPWHRHVTSAARVIFTHRGWLAAIPVILVNAVAFGAQLGFWRVHVPTVAEAVLVALALESIAIYLAWQAHLAQLADDSALRLRLAAYGMALVIGALNYSHFDGPSWRPTVPAVTFGMMSAISPWLWSVHSRRQSRDALKAKGLIEPHAVRLGATRWFWHPWPCIRVMSRATWVGENDPVKAIALLPVKTAGAVAAGVADDDGGAAASAPPVTSELPRPERTEPAAKAVKTPSPKPAPKLASKRAGGRPSSGRAKAIAVIKEDGNLPDEEVAARADVSESTVRRARAELANVTPEPS